MENQWISILNQCVNINGKKNLADTLKFKSVFWHIFTNLRLQLGRCIVFKLQAILSEFATLNLEGQNSKSSNKSFPL